MTVAVYYDGPMIRDCSTRPIYILTFSSALAPINTGKPAGAAGPTIVEVKYVGPRTFYGANFE
jgi:hypothetical protein